jgi:hypothetical protein
LSGKRNEKHRLLRQAVFSVGQSGGKRRFLLYAALVFAIDLW